METFHPAPEKLQEAVYGLPEIRPQEIAAASLVASPGCYPTSILLPLLPIVKSKIIDTSTIHVVSMSGTSGAGKTPNPQLLLQNATRVFVLTLFQNIDTYLRLNRSCLLLHLNPLLFLLLLF